MRHFIAALFVAAAALGARCNGEHITPPVGPGTDYPCGLQGRECPNHACCGLDDICGAPHSRCPAGMCCYDGPSFARRDGGAGNEQDGEGGAMRPQFPVR